MSPTIVLGFVLSIGVLVSSLVLAFKNINTVIDSRAILLVFGGTLAATMICFPMKEILTLLKVFGRRVLGRNQHDFAIVVQEIVRVAKAHKMGQRAFEQAVAETSIPFLKDGGDILSWSDSDINLDELQDLLETRALTHYEIYLKQAEYFRTIAKFPPAFGLMGTTIGMMALLESLGSKNNFTTIGPAMAIALATTLYGLALSNFILTPIAENLEVQSEADYQERRMIVEGLVLMQQGRPIRYIEEKVQSFILPSKRQKSTASSQVAGKV